MTLSQFVDTVREKLDQIVYTEDSARVEKNLLTSRASVFTDFDLIERGSRASMFIASRVRNETIPKLINSSNQPSGIIDKDFYRLINSTFLSTAVTPNLYIKRKTLSELRNVHDFQTTTDDPIYFYEDGFIDFFLTGDPLEAQATYSGVSVPHEIESYVGDTFSVSGITISSLPSDTETYELALFDQELTESLGRGVNIQSRFLTLKISNTSYRIDSSVDGSPDVLTLYRSGILYLPEHLQYVAVELAVSDCLLTLDMAEDADNNKNKAIKMLEPYLLTRFPS